MATLGADLQHARELAGLSLDDLSARTKIRRHMLESIERNEFSSIPGGLLARGYLRAYAREVGLPPKSSPPATRPSSARMPRAGGGAQISNRRLGSFQAGSLQCGHRW